MSNESAPTASTGGGNIDLARMFGFFFEDPNWIPKLVVGSIFALFTPLLVGSIFVAGYAIAVARSTLRGPSAHLPEWDDLQSIVIDGVKGFAISLAHKLPLVLLTCLLLLAMFGSAFLSREGGELSDAMLYIGVPVVLTGWLFVIVLSFAILAYVPAAFVRFVQTDDLAAAFDVRDVIAFIRRHPSDYALAVLGILLAAMIGQLGFIFFCIGVFPTTFWSACAAGHIVGELARLESGPPQS